MDFPSGAQELATHSDSWNRDWHLPLLSCVATPIEFLAQPPNSERNRTRTEGDQIGSADPRLGRRHDRQNKRRKNQGEQPVVSDNTLHLPKPI